MELGDYRYQPILYYLAQIRKILGVPYQTHSYLLPWLAGCLPIDLQVMLRSINFVLRAVQSPNNITTVLMSLPLNGSNSSISKSVKNYLYKLHLCNDAFTFCYNSPAHFRRSMQCNDAADICEDLVTTVQHIWEILDEDTPRVFSRT